MSKVTITPGLQGERPRLKFLAKMPDGHTYGYVVVGEEDGTFDTAVIGAALDVLDIQVGQKESTPMKHHESETDAPDDIAMAERLNHMEAVIADLDSRILSGKYNAMYLRAKEAGVASRQVAALIDILIEKGVL